MSNSADYLQKSDSADATCNWVGTIVRSKCQILQAVRKGHAFRTLVVQNVRQGDIYQTVAEFITKSQTDKDVPKKKHPKIDDLSWKILLKRIIRGCSFVLETPLNIFQMGLFSHFERKVQMNFCFYKCQNIARPDVSSKPNK